MDIKQIEYGDNFLYVNFGTKILRKNMKLGTPWEEVPFPDEFVKVEDQKNAIEKNNDKLTQLEETP